MKKIITLVVIAILAITAVVFVSMLKSRNKQLNSAKNNPASGSQKSSDATNGKGNNNTASNTVGSNDADIKGIESDLNSIDDSDFSDDKLSDQNVGL